MNKAGHRFVRQSLRTQGRVGGHSAAVADVWVDYGQSAVVIHTRNKGTLFRDQIMLSISVGDLGAKRRDIVLPIMERHLGDVCRGLESLSRLAMAESHLKSHLDSFSRLRSALIVLLETSRAIKEERRA